MYVSNKVPIFYAEGSAVALLFNRVRTGQGKSWKTGMSGKTIFITGKSGIVRKNLYKSGKIARR